MKGFFVLLTMIFLNSAMAATTIKVGVLAPDGTSWANQLKKMMKEIKEVTKDEVNFKFYFGGSQGDESDVLRKIRIGQLHGGVFTGKTLGDVSGEIRVMELPFNFYHDREKGWKILTKLSPKFDQAFLKAGLVNLGNVEIGPVYFVSKKRVENIDQLKGLKIWAWEGDPVVLTMIEKMNLISVPLPLPDVLSSLSTGIIEAAYASPMGILALQWNSKINFLVDFPVAYSVGAFLVDQKIWGQINAATQKSVQEIIAKYLSEVNQSTVKENNDALNSLKSSGITFVKFPESDTKKGKEIRSKVVEALKGKVFSAEVYNALEKELK